MIEEFGKVRFIETKLVYFFFLKKFDKLLYSKLLLAHNILKQN